MLEEMLVAHAIVGRWGKNLAVRLPLEVVKAAGVRTGEKVDVEARGSDIVIRRTDADAAADAHAAAEEIIEESEEHSLGDITIAELLSEGRRG
jgi:antitoxin component of MazEF toxin-antitoxin module